MEPALLMTRQELEAALFALYDLVEEVRKIRRLLEDENGEEEVQEDLGQ